MKPHSIHALKKRLDDIVAGNGKTEEIKTFLEQEEDETEEEVHKVVQPKSSIKKFIFIGIFLFFCTAAGMAWLGYAVFNPYNKKEPVEGMRLAVNQGDMALAGGSDVRYDITYENTEKNSAEDIVLIIEYPTGFSLKHTSLTPQNTQKNYWEIGALQAGERGMLTIEGTIIGRKNEEKQFFATMYYRPSTMNTQFVVKKSWKLTISSQLISFDGPSETIAGEPITYTISYNDLRSIGGGSATLLHVDIPQSFLIREISPKPDGGANNWTLDTLLKNMNHASESGVIKISGVYQEGVSGTIGMRVSLESPNGGTKTSTDLAFFQTKVNEDEQASKEDVTIKFLLNNSSSNMPVTLGASLEYGISIEHTGKIPLKDIKVQLQFKNLPTGMVAGQWKSGIMGGSTKEIKDATLEWTAADIPEFSVFDLGEKNDLTVLMYMPKKIEASNALLDATALISGTKEGAQVIVSSASIQSPINSDFELLLDSAITDNELVAQKPKTYHIEWAISNSLHELKDLKVSARVPSAVTWMGNETVTAGEMYFDKQSRHILWTLNRLPVSVQKVFLAFDVQITPTEDDLKRTDTCLSRKPLPLISKIIASATDSVAKSTIQSDQSMVIQGPPLEECKK
jgi:hypothetical protein